MQNKKRRELTEIADSVRNSAYSSQPLAIVSMVFARHVRHDRPRAEPEANATLAGRSPPRSRYRITWTYCLFRHLVRQFFQPRDTGLLFERTLWLLFLTLLYNENDKKEVFFYRFMYFSSLAVPFSVLILIYMAEHIFRCHVVLGATSGPVSPIRHQSYARFA
jgi:hypothetical protein